MKALVVIDFDLAAWVCGRRLLVENLCIRYGCGAGQLCSAAVFKKLTVSSFATYNQISQPSVFAVDLELNNPLASLRVIRSPRF